MKPCFSKLSTQTDCSPGSASRLAWSRRPRRTPGGRRTASLATVSDENFYKEKRFYSVDDVTARPVKRVDIRVVELLEGPFLRITKLNEAMLLETFDADRLLARFRIEAGLEPKAAPYDGTRILTKRFCSVDDAIPRPVKRFDIEVIELLEGPFLRAVKLNEAMLLESFDSDRLLARFRIEAGLVPKAAPYDGWEAKTIAGHSLGHCMKACALMFNTTNEEKFKRIVSHIVEELAACQAADPDGYVGAFAKGKAIFTEEVAKGDIRAQKFDLNGLWAPFYTQHKLLDGLIAALKLCDIEKALVVAEKFAHWIQSVVKDLSDEQLQSMLHCEHGGINGSFADLFAVTGNEEYLNLANTFYHNAILDPLANKEDVLPGNHANTQIPKVIGLARRYELTGRAEDLTAVKFFWDRVVNHHSYVTGGHGNFEYFGKPGELNKRLSHDTTETCNVYNMLKLSMHMFEWQPTAEVADFYERALFNHILSSQHPVSGKVTYNLSLEMGGFKVYEDPHDFTCCVGSGMESHAKHAQHIYYHNEDEIYVSQFIASRLTWNEQGVTLTQETRYPDEQATSLILSLKAPKTFTLHVRYPQWAECGIEVLVNSEKIVVRSTPGSFVSITREWRDRDTMSLKFPFTLRLEHMPDNPARIAMMYGPLVLAGDLGDVDDANAYDADYVPIILSEKRCVDEWLTPVGGSPNTFRTKEGFLPRDIELKPFYMIHDRRYSVYFDLFTAETLKKREQAVEEQRRAKESLDAATVDCFELGQEEAEHAHSFGGQELHVCSLKGKTGRVAYRGGHFQFTMRVLPDEDMALVVEYFGGYTGSKTFDIIVEGECINTENITDKEPGEFINVRYAIPGKLTRGKSNVSVAFRPHVGHRAGPVFSVRTVRS